MAQATAPARRHRVENHAVTAVMAIMAVLPLVELLSRPLFNSGVPGSALLVQHLTLWVAFMGAAVAARKERLLALSTATFLPPSWRVPVRVFTHAVAAAITTFLVAASVDLVVAERSGGEMVALGIPTWVSVLVMPMGLTLVTLRLAWNAGALWLQRAVPAAVVLLSAAALLWLPEGAVEATRNTWVVNAALVGLVAATALGLPMFAALGGAALLLFHADAVPAASVTVEAYRLSSSPLFPAIPLFTLGGYILSAGGASGRLVRVFSAWFGWMPGGPAVVTALVFAFFTSFTGASGVTILSMGGLLLPVLLKTHFPERFSIGLLTTSGSIGLLFPPSLPVILYAVSAQVGVDRLFVGGLVPGLMLVGGVVAAGMWQGVKQKIPRPPFNRKEAWSAAWEARYELALPVVVLVGIFGGFATLVEAAALVVVYSFVVERFVYRDKEFHEQLPAALEECAMLTGGVLLILGMALGFTNWMLDAQIPMHMLAWVKAHVDSPLVFLLILNGLLLVVGATMDIYSGILVVVPLVVPMGAAFGIDPVHLGVVFLANLELGYLVPPVGENLFLSSYRFHKPLVEVFRATLPFVIIIAVVVLLITYLPILTLGPVHLIYGN